MIHLERMIENVSVVKQNFEMSVPKRYEWLIKKFDESWASAEMSKGKKEGDGEEKERRGKPQFPNKKS